MLSLFIVGVSDLFIGDVTCLVCCWGAGGVSFCLNDLFITLGDSAILFLPKWFCFCKILLKMLDSDCNAVRVSFSWTYFAGIYWGLLSAFVRSVAAIMIWSCGDIDGVSQLCG